MKTTKRSKMLLSSIAMLLVALVALGSATYAWYTLNKTVSASDVTITAAAPEGLLISNASDSGWTDRLTWTDFGQTLNPESITFTAPTNTMTAATDIISAQVTAEAAGNTEYTKSSQAVNVITSAPVPTTDENYEDSFTNVVKKTFYVKSTGAATLTDVVATLTPSGTTTNTYANAVLVDFTDQKVLACVTSAGTRNGYLTTSGTATQWPDAYTDGKDINGDDISGVTSVWATGEAQSSTGASHYEKNIPHILGLVVYIDGQNSNCNTNNAVLNSLNEVNFEVSFSTNLNH